MKRMEAANADLSNQCEKLRAEKDAFDREMRDRETKLLLQRNEYITLQEKFEDIEKEYRMLVSEKESNQLDAGKSINIIQQENHHLRNELEDIKATLEEAEDEVTRLVKEKQSVEVSCESID